MLEVEKIYRSTGGDGTLVLLTAVLGERVQVVVGRGFGTRTIFADKITTMARKDFEDNFQLVPGQ